MRGKFQYRPLNRGAKSKLSTPTQRLLIRKARTDRFSARQLRVGYTPFLTAWTVQQMLQDTSELRWARAMAAPTLSKNQCRHHFCWCCNHVKRGASFWYSVVFSDKDRWNIDGPDGVESYRHNDRRECRYQSHSPNLNPIENLRSELFRLVHKNGGQYGNVADLRDAIAAAW